MPDDPTNQPAGDPPAGDPPAADPPADPPAGGGDGDLTDGAKKALAAARSEAREAQKRATAAEAKLKEIDDRDKSETQKATEAAAAAEARAEAAEAKVAQISREGWLTKAAVAAKFIDPDDAVAMLAHSDLEDEDAAKKAIERLAKSKPHLLGERQAGAGGFAGGQRGGGTSTKTDMDTMIRRSAGRAV